MISHPGISGKEISEQLAISKASLYNCAKRLGDQVSKTKTREGRTNVTKYYPGNHLPERIPQTGECLPEKKVTLFPEWEEPVGEPLPEKRIPEKNEVNGVSSKRLPENTGHDEEFEIAKERELERLQAKLDQFEAGFKQELITTTFPSWEQVFSTLKSSDNSTAKSIVKQIVQKKYDKPYKLIYQTVEALLG